MNDPRKCSKCGADIDDYDGGIVVNQKMGYGSDFDGTFILMKLCCKCSDKLIKGCKLQVAFDDPPTEPIY